MISAKLKNVRAEIEKLLKDNDIAGFVVLHETDEGGGRGEAFMCLEPSYSCAKKMPNELGYRFKTTHLSSKSLKKKKVEATTNMLSMISEMSGRMLLGVMQLSEVLDKLFEASHFNRMPPKSDSENFN